MAASVVGRSLVVAMVVTGLLWTLSRPGASASALGGSRYTSPAPARDGATDSEPDVSPPTADRVPAGVRTLKVARSEKQSSGGAEARVTSTQTVTDANVIAGIIRVVDAQPIVGPGQSSCTIDTRKARSVRLTFLSATATKLAVATYRSNSLQQIGCNTVAFTVRGHAMIPLADGSQLIRRVDQLLAGQASVP